jgi:hypothetical protein
MRVKQLVVINLCDDFKNPADLTKPHQMLEDRQVAYGLFTKHTGKGDGTAPKAAWWIEVDNTAETGDAAELKADVHYKLVKSFAGDLATFDTKDRDVGVYIIYHGKKSSDPNIFGVTPMGKADNKKVQAKRLVGILERLKIRPIRKLSLVACHSDSQKSAAGKNFLVAVGEQLEAWRDDRPMIAGYDDYVTASWKDGRKIAGEEKGKGTLHKHVWVYRSGMLGSGYKTVVLEQSGWSDKHNLPTNTGVAAVF